MELFKISTQENCEYKPHPLWGRTSFQVLVWNVYSETYLISCNTFLFHIIQTTIGV